jgi:hypothetical protein
MKLQSTTPSAVQRERVEHVETVEYVNTVDLVDAPRDIVVGHKRHAWARQTLQEAEGHAALNGTLR